MDKKIYDRRIEVLSEKEESLLKEYGWYVHYFFETPEGELNGLANIHTHGLKENFNHPDLQIVLPLAPETAHPVLTSIVNQIKGGEKFVAKERYSNVLQGMDVCFASYTENNRSVLRLMIPDPKGYLPDNQLCEDIYKRQLELLPE